MAEQSKPDAMQRLLHVQTDSRTFYKYLRSCARSHGRGTLAVASNQNNITDNTYNQRVKHTEWVYIYASKSSLQISK
jgi:hypothetical protein